MIEDTYTVIDVDINIPVLTELSSKVICRSAFDVLLKHNGDNRLVIAQHESLIAAKHLSSNYEPALKTTESVNEREIDHKSIALLSLQDVESYLNKAVNEIVEHTNALIAKGCKEGKVPVDALHEAAEDLRDVSKIRAAVVVATENLKM